MLEALLTLLLAQPVSSPAADVQGLWRYQSIARPGGDDVALGGLFLFRDGFTVQQSLNAGEPVDRQVVQAHFGTYRPLGLALGLVSEVGLVIDPTKTPSLDSRRNAEHEVRVSRSGDHLTLTFGTGTVQKFVRVGPGAGDLVLLDHGALALVDGQFLLVVETGERTLAGYGTAQRRDRTLTFNAACWLTLVKEKATVERNRTVRAVLDGDALEIEGLRVRVKR